MCIRDRPELDLFNFDGVLFLTCFTGCSSSFIPVLPVIHHLDDGRAGVRSDLYEIHPTVCSTFAGFVDGNDSNLFTIVLDEPYRADPDLLINAGSSFADFLSTSFLGMCGGRQGPISQKKPEE